MSRSLKEMPRSEGAVTSDYFGISLPENFGDFEAEYWSVRRGTGMFDARFRSLLRATGEDRISFFQGMLSNDVATLTPGMWMEAAHLTVQGRVVSDVRVYADEDSLLLDVPAHRRQAFRETLEKFIIADDVELADPEVVALLGLEGPTAEVVMAEVLGSDAADVAIYHHRTIPFGDGSLRVAGMSYAGGRGYLCIGPEALAEDLWSRFSAAGATAVGMKALDVLRIEAGIPWYGCDMDESILAPEAGIASAISFSKGCYLGQEIVERATARGQLQKKLVGLHGHGRDVPERGTRVNHAGDDVGWITSAAWSPERNQIVALGYVRRSAWAPGKELEVAGSETTLVIDERVPSLV